MVQNMSCYSGESLTAHAVWLPSPQWVFGMSFSLLNPCSIHFLCVWQPYIRAGLVLKCSHCDDGCWCLSSIPQTAVCSSIARFQMWSQLGHCWGGGGRGISTSTGQDHRIFVVMMSNSFWICEKICGETFHIEKQRSKVSYIHWFPEW